MNLASTSAYEINDVSLGFELIHGNELHLCYVGMQASYDGDQFFSLIHGMNDDLFCEHVHAHLSD